MSGFSTYLDNKLLDLVFSGTAYETPSKYIALFYSDAGLTENNSTALQEVSGTAYARVAVSNDKFSVASNSSVQNLANIEFPVAESDWGTVTHIAIMDAATDGNVLAWGVVRNPITMDAQPRDILTGDQFIIRTTTFNVRLQDNAVI
jgi:hypothetical protein|nr:MAG TPA: hypothetical protein [Caudoviricetes sp.]